MIGITLLALLLGGATELWALATVAGAMVVVIFVAPPEHSPGWPLLLMCAGLLLLAGSAFLPASWGETPGWRVFLEGKLHLSLPVTRTPQPWLTVEAIGYLFICLTWLLYLLSLRWTEPARQTAAGWLVAGVAVLSAVAIFCFATDTRMPFWENRENRGWFPNRNQMANVLALCGVLNYALIFDRTSLNRRRFWWVLALVAICAGLVISLSRAGILLLFAGLALWHLAQWRGRRLNARTAGALAGACLLLSLFLLFGGETIERFQPGLQESARKEFRVPVQRDAIRFSKKEPWLGVGLGNFASLFPRERDASVAGNKAIHPESDWLWGAVELGWLAPLLVGLGAIWWWRLVWAGGAVGWEPLRLAAAVGVVIFALHGLVDVSAHRLGSFGVAAFLAAMALPSTGAARRGGAMAFRSAAVGIAVFWDGGWPPSPAGACRRRPPRFPS